VAPYALEGRNARLVAADHIAPEVARSWLDASPPQDRTILIGSAIGTVRFKPGKHRRNSRALQLGFSLAERGAPVSAPLGVLIAPGGRLDPPSWLILRHERGVDLSFLLNQARELGPDLRARLWRAIAGAVAALHGAGFRQRDLKAPNVLVDWPAPREEDPRVLLLDLDGMRRCRLGVPARLRRADLGRLAASLSTPAARAAGIEPGDWSALLSNYLQATAVFSAQDLRRWEKATRALAERKLARNARLGRPTA
jgi:hypothetical protein